MMSNYDFKIGTLALFDEENGTIYKKVCAFKWLFEIKI